MTITHSFDLDTPAPFDFESTAIAHGWIDLAPNGWLGDRPLLHRVDRLPSGKVVIVEVAPQNSPSKLIVQVQSPTTLTSEDCATLEQGVRWMLRLDEDFSSFYQLCGDRGEPWSRLVSGKGRLLRSPTLFEDIVKTICTTNTTWSGTIRMVKNLVAVLGEPCALDDRTEHTRRAFPTPEAIARAPLEQLQKEVKLGYRAAYIQHLAQRIVSGELVLDDFQNPDLPTADLKRQLLALKGVGAYAAHTLLMLLSRYEELAIDSEMRAFTRQRYFNGTDPSDRQIRALYEDWGEWKYLAYWFDLLPDGYVQVG